MTTDTRTIVLGLSPRAARALERHILESPYGGELIDTILTELSSQLGTTTPGATPVALSKAEIAAANLTDQADELAPGTTAQRVAEQMAAAGAAAIEGVKP